MNATETQLQQDRWWKRRRTGKEGEGSRFIGALCLYVLVIVGGMTMFPALAWAEERTISV